MKRVKKEIIVDERGRTNLARVRSHPYDRYTVEEFPDGTLVLTPAVTVSPLELAALHDPAVTAAAAEAKGRTRKMGWFATTDATEGSRVQGIPHEHV